MAELLKDYHPTGKGRPPTNPKKLRLWKAANKALHAKNEEAPAKEAPVTPKKKEAAPETPKKKKAAPKKPSATVTPIKRAGATKAAAAAAARKPKGLARAFTPQPQKANGLDKVSGLLSDSNLHDIIALCRKEGISRLKTAGFEIEFGTLAGAASTGPEPAKQPENPVPINSTAPTTASPTPHVLSSDPSAMDDLDETQDLIDHPGAWEQRQVDGHLSQGAVSAESPDRRAESDLRGS